LRSIETLHHVTAAKDRALRWILAMQNPNGGWAAFDRDNMREAFTHVPFADHNAMLDPTAPDLTGRVLEMLGRMGIGSERDPVARGLRYVLANQEPDGSWYGRWGVNYIYGTWQALVGLRAVQISTGHPAVIRAARWLVSCQQACGGWGESCRSYDDPRWKGCGEVTPSQTAWALMGLMAAGHGRSSAVERGVRYLVETQRPDGDWDEPQFTGTGFPKVFYLKYHLYRVYFPLMALARYALVGGELVNGSSAASSLASAAGQT
jgi:squalene-hopene/tetraprenyl-beta-curcumene cyclase